MSEYRVLDVEFKDEDVLTDALKEMGFQPEVNKESQQLNSRYLRGREVKGNIIIRQHQHGGCGDIGFERQQNGKYAMHYDSMDVGEGRRFSMEKLKRYYAECGVKKLVKSTTRYTMISRKEEQDGKIRLRLRRNNV